MRRLRPSSDSSDSLLKHTTEATTPQTSRQWSDEVAAEDDEKQASKCAGARVAGRTVQQRHRQQAFTDAVGRALGCEQQINEEMDQEIRKSDAQGTGTIARSSSSPRKGISDD